MRWATERAHISASSYQPKARSRMSVRGSGGQGQRADQAGVPGRSARLAGRRESLPGDREDRRPTAACDTGGSGSRSEHGSSSPMEYAATREWRVVDATPVTAGCRIFVEARGDRASCSAQTTYARRVRRRCPRSASMTQDELTRNIVAGFTRLGFPRRRERPIRKMDRAAPRQRDASAPPRRRHRDDRRRVACEGISRTSRARSCSGKPSGQIDGGKSRNARKRRRSRQLRSADLRERRRGGAQGHRGCGLWSGCKVPGLPHPDRTRIGLDGHEWTNFVRNKTPIRPGMCFSDEPMLAIPGEFGIRLEDDVYIREGWPALLPKPSLAIDRPFAD